jgi:hypothetical protein
MRPVLLNGYCTLMRNNSLRNKVPEAEMVAEPCGLLSQRVLSLTFRASSINVRPSPYSSSGRGVLADRLQNPEQLPDLLRGEDTFDPPGVQIGER